VFIRFYGDCLERGEVKEAAPHKADAEFLRCVPFLVARDFLLKDDCFALARSAITRIGERLPCAASLGSVTAEWIEAASTLAGSE